MPALASYCESRQPRERASNNALPKSNALPLSQSPSLTRRRSALGLLGVVCRVCRVLGELVHGGVVLVGGLRSVMS